MQKAFIGGAFKPVVSGPKPSVVFVLGGPGAGKGTQCDRIKEMFGFKHISSGDCLRDERNKPGSKHAELIESYVKEGKLVPVELVLQLVKDKMQELGWAGGKFLIDGFPRGQENWDGWTKSFTGADAVEEAFCLFFDCSEVPSLHFHTFHLYKYTKSLVSLRILA